MNDREHVAYERGRMDGYAAGYEAGAAGHLPPSSVVVILPDGYERFHNAIVEALTEVVHAEIGNGAQVFRLDGLAPRSPTGVG